MSLQEKGTKVYQMITGMSLYEKAIKMANPPFNIHSVRTPSGIKLNVIDESHLIGGSKQRVISMLMPYDI